YPFRDRVCSLPATIDWWSCERREGASGPSQRQRESSLGPCQPPEARVAPGVAAGRSVRAQREKRLAAGAAGRAVGSPDPEVVKRAQLAVAAPGLWSLFTAKAELLGAAVMRAASQDTAAGLLREAATNFVCTRSAANQFPGVAAYATQSEADQAPAAEVVAAA